MYVCYVCMYDMIAILRTHVMLCMVCALCMSVRYVCMIRSVIVTFLMYAMCACLLCMRVHVLCVCVMHVSM